MINELCDNDLLLMKNDKFAYTSLCFMYVNNIAQ